VNGGRNYDQTVVVPKTKSGYLLEYPVDPALPLVTALPND